MNYVYLPYDAQNMIGGRIAADGSVVTSSDPNGFSLSKSGTGEYLLTIDGKTPEDGMLLLNATGPNGSNDNCVVYEPAGSSFRIIGLDMITIDESLMGALVDPEDTSFSFAYIDFDAPPTLAVTPGDFDGNGVVDGDDLTVWRTAFGSSDGADADGDGDSDLQDLLVWQRNSSGSGGLGASSAAIPEPCSIMIALALMGLATMYRTK